MGSNGLKPILIISYYWPPAGGVVVRRVLSLAKYLPQFGFEPIILCAGGENPWLTLDKNTPIPDVEVHRIDAGDLNSLFAPGGAPVDVRIKAAMRAVFRTDYMARWADRAYSEARKIIKERDIELVLVTSPPFSVQSIGAKLKREFPLIKYVADLRDLFYSFRKGNPVLTLRRLLAIPRAKRHLCAADLTVVVSPGFEKALSAIGIETETVPLGFDCRIAQAEDYSRGEEFRIVHAGSFPSTGQTPEFVLVAFDMACQFNAEFCRKARLIFAGVTKEYIDSKTPKFAGRPDNITALGQLSHESALELERGADTNLLILTIPSQVGGNDIIPGKFYEYVASRRPIFATCASNSVVARLIEDNEIGVVSRNSPDEIQSALLRLFHLWLEGKLPHGATPETAEKFRAKNLIANYTRILKECLD